MCEGCGVVPLSVPPSEVRLEPEPVTQGSRWAGARSGAYYLGVEGWWIKAFGWEAAPRLGRVRAGPLVRQR
jgi:hypothetical protein